MSVLALVRSTPHATASAVLDMKQKLVDYWNAVATINANAFAITKTQLSAIDDDGPAPDWWTTLSTNFTSCRGHAQVWIDTIYPSLTRVPQSIVSYNTFFTVTSNSIIQEVKKFAGRTPTAQEKAAVQSKLNLLLTQLGKSKTQVAGVRTDVTRFTDSFEADRTALTTGTASVMKALTADKEKVEQINALIEELKAEVKALEAQMGIASVGIGLSIGIGFLVGGVAGLVIGLIGVGVSVAVMVVLGVKLSAKNDAIEAETAKLGPLARRTVSLNVIDSSVQDLHAAIGAIKTCAEVVSKTWEGLEADLGNIITKLTSARDEEWADIIQKGLDIGAAQEAWKSLDKFARDLQNVGTIFDETEYRLEGAA